MATTPPDLPSPSSAASAASTPKPLGTPSRRPFAREVRRRIDRALGSVSAEPGTDDERVERFFKTRLARAWGAFKRRPSAGVLLAGGLGLAAAEVVGVAELAIALGCAYAAYEVLKKRLPISEAVERTEALFRR